MYMYIPSLYWEAGFVGLGSHRGRAPPSPLAQTIPVPAFFIYLFVIRGVSSGPLNRYESNPASGCMCVCVGGGGGGGGSDYST